MGGSSRSPCTPAAMFPGVAVLVLLAVAAALWNLRAPTVFFDSQIMLGGSLAVFALLLFGWPGVLVGVAALIATAIRWGHPYELLIGTTFLVWLGIFLNRCNGGWSKRDNGRVVLAAAAFWLVVGIPLELVLFNRGFDMPFSRALGIGLKESVTGLLNTTIGLLAFLVVRGVTLRGQPGGFSVRGLTFAAILAAISIPGLGLTLILSRQLKSAAIEQQFQDLHGFGQRVADRADLGTTEALDALANATSNKEFLLRRVDGTVVSSDPALFERLDQHYSVETPARTGRDDLGILRTSVNGPVIRTDADSYWFATFDRPPASRLGDTSPVATITVVETPPEMVSMLDYQLLLPSFSALLALLLGGVAVAEWAGQMVDRHSAAVLPPPGGQSPSCATLAASPIREINTLVDAVNERTHRIQAATAREKELEEAHRRDLENKLKTSLSAAAVAHEINQPLSRILLRAQMELEHSAGHERDTLSALVADTQRVVTIIDRMCVLLRNVHTPHHAVDLAEVVSSAVLQVKALLHRESITVHTALTDVRCLVSGDEVQLQIALINLLTNAAHAIAVSGSPRREIRVELVPGAGGCDLVVGDSGPGWPGGTIVDMLLRTSKPDGTGIGLYIVTTTVDHHGGRMSVGQSPLGGAEFRISLPADRRAATLPARSPLGERALDRDHAHDDHAHEPGD